MFDSVQALARKLMQEAIETGETQITTFGDGKTKRIVRGGKVVGSYRVFGLTITIKPPSQHKPVNTATAQTTSKPKRQRGRDTKLPGGTSPHRLSDVQEHEATGIDPMSDSDWEELIEDGKG